MENDLITILDEPIPKMNLCRNKLKGIKKDFNKLRYRLSKLQINKFRRNLYNIKNQKNISPPEIKETEKNLLEFEIIFLVLSSIMIMMTLNTEE